MNAKLESLLNRLENYNIYLYDNGTAVYFMDTKTERKSRFFRNDDKNLKKRLESFCLQVLERLEK